MPAKLEPGKKLKRLIKVYGIEGDVEVSMSHEGLTFRVPRTRLILTATWPDVVEKASCTPDNVPCFLAGEPMKFLQHEQTKVAKKRAKKEAAQ